jgi:general stress protein 26
MTGTDPVGELDPTYSADGVAATPWSEALRHLTGAEIYWISTVRPDGRPHVTPLLAVWRDDALYFTTGDGERKAANLRANPACVLTTGNNSVEAGIDVVVEGRAEPRSDPRLLSELAVAWEAKYGPAWHYDVRDGMFINPGGGQARVYRVRPTAAFAFGKGTFSQTRYVFGSP